MSYENLKHTEFVEKYGDSVEAIYANKNKLHTDFFKDMPIEKQKVLFSLESCLSMLCTEDNPYYFNPINMPDDIVVKQLLNTNKSLFGSYNSERYLDKLSQDDKNLVFYHYNKEITIENIKKFKLTNHFIFENFDKLSDNIIEFLYFGDIQIEEKYLILHKEKFKQIAVKAMICHRPNFRTFM